MARAPHLLHNRPNHEGREKEGATPEALIRQARLILDATGVRMSPSKVSKLVRTYLHQVAPNGHPFPAYLANAAELSAAQRQQVCRVIGYADPTGETAVRNVMRGGRDAT